MAKDDDVPALLPHNLEVERSTLGAALLATRAADYLVHRLQPAAFFRRAHQQVFIALQELRTGNVDVDLKTVLAKLGTKGVKDVGGPAYLTALADGIPSHSNLEHYANILDDLKTKRALVKFGSAVLERVAGGDRSAHDLLVEIDREVLEMQGGYDAGHLASLGATTTALLENLQWRIDHRGQVTGVDTGFKSINEITNGWQAADYMVLGARPSIGKTTFAVNTTVAAARAALAAGTGRRVAVFSMEMTREQLEYRILSSMSNVPLTRLLGGYVMEGLEWTRLSEAVNEMSMLPIDIDDAAARTVWDIRGTCRRLQAEHGLDLVVIDYVQLMPGTLERRGATRNEEITDISRRLKILAGELRAPIILLSQLSRAAADRPDPRPKLSDLRDSGALEQDADLVCFLHRKNHREGGVTNFIIEKQRNGPTGTLNLTLDRDVTLFTDGGEEPPPPAPTEQEKQDRKARAIRKRRAHSS